MDWNIERDIRDHQVQALPNCFKKTFNIAALTEFFIQTNTLCAPSEFYAVL